LRTRLLQSLTQDSGDLVFPLSMENEIKKPATPPGRLSRANVASPAFADLITLGVAAVILALPLLLHGPMVKGHDTYQHLNFGRHFSEQFWNGEWYPRWLQGMNHGLGSPSLFVYPPFPSYVYALLQPAGRVFHFNSFNAGEFLALLSSGIFAFLWLHTMVSRSVALVSAVLYLLIPYHLAVDFYRRDALSECWALAWMPLVLYFTVQIMRGKRSALWGLSVAYALLILSHLVSALIFLLVPLAAVLTLSPRGQGIQSTLRVAAGIMLGTGLSCFYLLSALFHSKYFSVLRLLRFFPVETNLISLADIQSGNSANGFVHWVSLSTVSTIAFMAICGFVVLLKGGSESKREIIFWFTVCVLPVFLMSSVSLPIWRLFPWLFQAVQYPWRFNIVLCLAGVSTGALFLSEVRRSSGLGRVVALGLVCLIVLAWLVSYGEIWSRYKSDVAIPRASSPRLLVNEDDGWFESWTVPEMNQASALSASAGPRVKFLQAGGISDVQVWRPRHIEFQTDSQRGGWVMINQFYYPAWTASLVGGGPPLEIKAAMPEGLLEVNVPPGHKQVRIEIPIGPAERIGDWISVTCALLSALLLYRPQKAKFREPLA
jgi:hypothetical protein